MFQQEKVELGGANWVPLPPTPSPHSRFYASPLRETTASISLANPNFRGGQEMHFFYLITSSNQSSVTKEEPSNERATMGSPLLPTWRTQVISIWNSVPASPEDVTCLARLALHYHVATTGQSCVGLALFYFIFKVLKWKCNMFLKIGIAFLCFKIPKVLKRIQWKISPLTSSPATKFLTQGTVGVMLPRDFSHTYKQIHECAYSPPLLFYINGIILHDLRMLFFSCNNVLEIILCISQNFARSFCLFVFADS